MSSRSKVGRTKTRGTSMNGEKRGRRWRGREPIGDERASSPSATPSTLLSRSLSFAPLHLPPSLPPFDLASSPFRTTPLHPRKPPPSSTVSRLPTSVTYLPQRGHPLPFKAARTRDHRARTPRFSPFVSENLISSFFFSTLCAVPSHLTP